MKSVDHSIEVWKQNNGQFWRRVQMRDRQWCEKWWMRSRPDEIESEGKLNDGKMHNIRETKCRMKKNQKKKMFKNRICVFAFEHGDVPRCTVNGNSTTAWAALSASERETTIDRAGKMSECECEWESTVQQ